MTVKPSGAKYMSKYLPMLMSREKAHSLQSLTFQTWSKPESSSESLPQLGTYDQC